MLRFSLLFLLVIVPLQANTPATPPDPNSPITVIDAWKDRVDQPAPEPPPIIDLTNAKQLFIDDWLIESSTGLTRTFHTAVKHEANPLLKPERPWEIPAVLLSGSVIYDPARTADRFRIWYLCYTPQHTPDFKGVKKKDGNIAYAVSSDGLHWHRPSLGLHEFNGSRDNNIVITGPYGFPGVIFDPRDPDPQRRYKAHARTSKGHTAYFSPDGIHWSEPRVMDLDGYDRSSVHWDPIRKNWFASTKSWFRVEPNAAPWRGRGYQPSNDFLHFHGKSKFLAATTPESEELVYALEPFYYESLFLGIWARYRHEPDGLLDPQLALSRNGFHWQRPTPQSLIPLSPLPANFIREKTPGSPETGVDVLAPGVPWDYGNTNINILGPLRVNDELWLYYSGRTSDHRTSPQTGAIGLAKLRLDGFASLGSTDQGTIITRPLHLAPGTLHLNADADNGELRAEFLDEQSQPIPGYTAAECTPLTTDNLRHELRWNNSPDLYPLQGKTVRLRVTLRNADLYALWVGDERPWHTIDSTTWQINSP